jgi:hypothetical protein
MRNFRASGGVRPSRPASLVAVVVGLGMLLAALAFIMGGPIIGIGVFMLAWVIALCSIIGYHAWNAFSPHGADHTQFHIQAEHDPSKPIE